jgi:hypothetical protein
MALALPLSEYRICRECPVRGDRLLPTSPAIVGRVERIDRTVETITFVGWAMDQENPDATLQLLVFADGASIAVGATSLVRLDVINRYKLGAQGRHGFQIVVPATHFATGNRQVNIYALDKQGALGLVRFELAN